MSVIDLRTINRPTLWWRKHRRYFVVAMPLIPPVMQQIVTFPASGTWVVPPNVKSIQVMGFGSGGGGAGGGGGASNGTGGGGGGTGGNRGAVVSAILKTTPGETLTITIDPGGVGGAGGARDAVGSPGVSGGPTTITGLHGTIVVPGGNAISINSGATRGGGPGGAAAAGAAGAAATTWTASTGTTPFDQLNGDAAGQQGRAAATNAGGGGGGYGGGGGVQIGSWTYPSTAGVDAAAAVGGVSTIWSLATPGADALALFPQVVPARGGNGGAGGVAPVAGAPGVNGATTGGGSGGGGGGGNSAGNGAAGGKGGDGGPAYVALVFASAA